MKTMKFVTGLMVACATLSACRSQAPAHQPTAEEAKVEKEKEADRKQLAALTKKYFKIPEKIMQEDGSGDAVYAELKQRYKADVVKLKELVEATGAKLVFVILWPRPDKGQGSDSRYGLPYVRSVCSDLGVEFVDFSPLIAAKDPYEMTQIPRDGHWSKKGAAFIADNLAPIITKYSNITSKVTYKDSERPETFGDFAPSSDEIKDGGKDMPYHVRANAQGVRMDADITFPKKKKHILFMGDSGIFCPFLNNEFTITGVLQQRFPETVIMNTGVICYTMEDYITLWNEKAKYSEPDIVFVQTNGGDITDYFFTHRNSLSRSHKPFTPSAKEEEFYRKMYPGIVE